MPEAPFEEGEPESEAEHLYAVYVREFEENAESAEDAPLSFEEWQAAFPRENAQGAQEDQDPAGGSPAPPKAPEGESAPESAAEQASVIPPELALAIREERGMAQPPGGSLPSATEFEASLAVAREIAGSKFVPESYRGDPESVVAAIFTGRELGIGPMQSLRDIHMIDGRPVFSASLLLGMLRKGGVEILASSSTAERAWIHARRRDTGEEAEVEWTFEEASKIVRKTKRLVDGDNWKNYPADMLWARAVGRLARRLGSDLLGGMHYTAEEMRDLQGFERDGYQASARRRGEVISWEMLEGDAALRGRKLQEHAPRGWTEILAVFEHVDPSRDWRWIVKGITQGVYKVESVRELQGDSYKEAGTRMANLAAYLRDRVMEGNDFPPPGDDELRAAIGWAFDGLYVETLDPPKDAAAEEVEEAEFVELDEAALRAASEDVEFAPELPSVTETDAAEEGGS